MRFIGGRSGLGYGGGRGKGMRGVCSYMYPQLCPALCRTDIRIHAFVLFVRETERDRGFSVFGGKRGILGENDGRGEARGIDIEFSVDRVLYDSEMGKGGVEKYLPVGILVKFEKVFSRNAYLKKKNLDFFFKFSI